VSHRSTWQSAPPPGRILERRRLLALLGLFVAGTLGGCGKKGPPRLPEPSSPAAPAAPETPTLPDTGADEETE
jgi:predicted small lipoprotein YifL